VEHDGSEAAAVLLGMAGFEVLAPDEAAGPIKLRVPHERPATA